MSKVSFYLIEKKPLRQAELACRLCKQISQQHRIWIYCADQAQCESLDELLWGFEATQFLPHAIDQIEQGICLSTQPPKSGFDVCLNFSQLALDPASLPHQDLHIIEIVGNTEVEKQASREVFKHYRNFGIHPVIHRI